MLLALEMARQRQQQMKGARRAGLGGAPGSRGCDRCQSALTASRFSRQGLAASQSTSTAVGRGGRAFEIQEGEKVGGVGYTGGSSSWQGRTRVSLCFKCFPEDSYSLAWSLHSWALAWISSGRSPKPGNTSPWGGTAEDTLNPCHWGHTRGEGRLHGIMQWPWGPRQIAGPGLGGPSRSEVWAQLSHGHDSTGPAFLPVRYRWSSYLPHR